MMASQHDFNITLCQLLGLDVDRVAGFQVAATGEDTTVIVEWITDYPGVADDALGNPTMQAFKLCPYEEGHLSDLDRRIIARLDACEDRRELSWILHDAVPYEVGEAYRRAMERLP